ncbi:uncharacterized protein LOC116343747 [Contarinia nasturtii]|uniref:uncharacterized protein LOC116343747 n=1 Tax=Contarinia nasturtii TaxID=265458 RepID=UPI0012D3F7E3|nr:uncharacterized protein LOC116343747 [Contarinia nasturtii]
MSPNSIAPDQVVASISSQTFNQVSQKISPILLLPPTEFADDVPPPIAFTNDEPTSTPFASHVRSLRRSTRRLNCLSSQAKAPSSPLEKNINIRLVANGSRTPICFVSSNNEHAVTNVKGKRNATNMKGASVANQAYGIITRSKTAKARSVKNVTFAEGLAQCRRSLFASKEDLGEPNLSKGDAP